MARPSLAELPDWPALMDVKTAARYCSMSAPHFLARCPVPPQRHGRRVLWSRKSIDAWIDRAQTDAVPVTEEDWVERLAG